MKNNRLHQQKWLCLWIYISLCISLPIYMPG